MITAQDIVNRYISSFEKRGHKRIANASLVPENDPTTLFTSSGMQPLVPYLLGEPYPQGKRLVNVQNCFRAQDIDELGDNRHTTFFRMLGNWSLGDYFKKEQLPWFFEFLTKELGLPANKLYVTVFEGLNDVPRLSSRRTRLAELASVPRDEESANIWKKIFENVGLDPKERIFYYGVDKNWWSRAGEPKNMPIGEPGGPDSEVFYDFEVPHDKTYGPACHPNCPCGRFLEIGNSVFMQYKKTKDGFEQLPQKNVDFGGGLERLLAAIENQQDAFATSLFGPIIKSMEKQTNKPYKGNEKKMRIIGDHLVSASFIVSAGIYPSNKEQGYILRRLIRRSVDYSVELGLRDIREVLLSIAEQYKGTDPYLLQNSFQEIVYVITQETDKYHAVLSEAKRFIAKKYGKKIGDELMGVTEISADDAFLLYSTHGFSPTQIKSLGYVFNEQQFAQKMEEHQNISRKGAQQKFAGGLADHSEKTIMGHTATHLMHQALRDVLGNHVHQTGSNITADRVRFDFNYDKKLSDEEIKEVEEIINKKIKENLPVHFEIIPLKKAKEIGAIGLFDEKYSDKVKVYFIGGSPSTHSVRSGQPRTRAYSVEFCGGPHVDFTSKIKRFKIIKQENIGKGYRRLYAKVD